MKKFAGHKTVDQIREQCLAQGVTLDTRLYDSGSSDYIKLTSTDGKTSAEVLYSSFNGRFFGQFTPGREFNSDDASLDGTPWFDALLEFFYIRKADTAAG